MFQFREYVLLTCSLFRFFVFFFCHFSNDKNGDPEKLQLFVKYLVSSFTVCVDSAWSIKMNYSYFAGTDDSNVSPCHPLLWWLTVSRVTLRFLFAIIFSELLGYMLSLNHSFLDKHMKDLLSKLLNSGYFENVPVLKNSKEKEEEMVIQSEKKKQLLKTESIKESGLL